MTVFRLLDRPVKQYSHFILIMSDGLMNFHVLSNFSGLIYAIFVPLYKSIKSLKSDEKFDDSQWLSYWCIFGALTLIEQCFSFISVIIPFYYEIKLGALGWLVQKKGATLVYKKVVSPLFDKFEKYVEDEKYRDEVNKMATEKI